MEGLKLWIFFRVWVARRGAAFFVAMLLLAAASHAGAQALIDEGGLMTNRSAEETAVRAQVSPESRGLVEHYWYGIAGLVLAVLAVYEIGFGTASKLTKQSEEKGIL